MTARPLEQASDPRVAAAMLALQDVLDPDTGIGLPDLGLIYDVSFAGSVVHVVMTLTTPSCPASGVMVEGVRRRLGALDGVTDVDVAITFEPAWTPSRISAAGRARLGW